MNDVSPAPASMAAPIWFDTIEELDRAVADIAALSPATRRVLARAIEHQGRTVTKVSPSAQQLEDLGFLFIRSQNRYDGSAVLSPSLWGEEALDTYEVRQTSRTRPRKKAGPVETRPAP